MRRVLIVDDDKSIREMLRAWLELEGFTTATAADGMEAVGFLAANEASWVVLMDVMMPRMNGHDACRLLATLPGSGRYRVALMTAGYGDDTKAPSLARAVLRKPFDFEQLSSVVELLSRELGPLPVVGMPFPVRTYSTMPAA